MENSISEERKKALITKIQKLEAYREIQNLMGRCVLAFNYRQQEKVLACFDLDKADVSVEVADHGLFIGKQSVMEFISTFIPSHPKAGELMDIQLASPIIEVADDCITARALWSCPGIGTIPKENEYQAIWNWGDIGADFIFDNGTWKLWHFHWFTLVKCDYTKGWVKDLSLINRPNQPMHPLSQPTTYHKPYTPQSVRECIPAIPWPYKTWDNANWMFDKNKMG